VKGPIHMCRLLNPNHLRKDTKGVIRSGKQFMLHMWHPSCYTYYKPDDKRRIRKGPDCDTKNIYICKAVTTIEESEASASLKCSSIFL
jgi:hypothetical protein